MNKKAAQELIAQIDALADAQELDTPRWRELIWAAQTVRGWLFVQSKYGNTRHTFAQIKHDALAVVQS